MAQFNGVEPGSGWKKKLECPVCHVHKLREDVGAELLINGRVTKVCSDCYWQAYRKVNIPRIKKARWSLYFPRTPEDGSLGKAHSMP